MNKNIAKESSKGGKAILKKYGKSYLRMLGRKGGKAKRLTKLKKL